MIGYAQNVSVDLQAMIMCGPHVEKGPISTFSANMIMH